LLGTIVEICLPSTDAAAFELAFAAITRVHKLMSFHDEGSDLARLRRAKPGSVTKVDPATARVLRYALELYEVSGGIFNIVVGRQLVRHGFLPRLHVGHLGRYCGAPTDISFVGPCEIRQNRMALIDLGGVAKGFAVDQAVEALVTAGVSGGIVNAGGDLRIFGDFAQTVVLRRGDGRGIEIAGLSEIAIASSENSRQRRRIGGMPLTPHIGPSGEALVINTLVSVAADSCMVADAMTKVAMIDPDLADRLLLPHSGSVLCRELN
jgi:thiamine biosynthesis lipoprotein